MEKSSAQVNILGVKVDILDVETLHTHIYNEVTSRNHSLILHVNVNGLNLAYENKWLRDYLNHAKLVFCDGAGVMIGAKLLGSSIRQRITYADWMWQLAEFAENQKLSLFLLGSKPGVSKKAAVCLKDRFKDLMIVGYHHGYFDKSNGHEANDIVIKEINAAKPNILVVGFGMPIQEKWFMENWDRIDAEVGLTGGAVFDYVSGELKRAPMILTNNGFEWLGRLFIEPMRLWKRYLIGNPIFFLRVLKQRFGIETYDAIID